MSTSTRVAGVLALAPSVRRNSNCPPLDVRARTSLRSQPRTVMSPDSRQIETATDWSAAIVCSAGVSSSAARVCLTPGNAKSNAMLNLVHLPSVPWLSSEFWVIPSLVIASLWGVGGGMLIFLGGLQGIPTELYEAAMIDGAGAWRKFRHVTIPMLSPTIFYNLIFGIIGSFQVFVLVFLLTGGAASGGNPGGPNYASYVFSIYIYQTAFQFGRLGYAAALGWVLFALILALTLIVFRSARFWVFYAGER